MTAAAIINRKEPNRIGEIGNRLLVEKPCMLGIVTSEVVFEMSSGRATVSQAGINIQDELADYDGQRRQARLPREQAFDSAILERDSYLDPILESGIEGLTPSHPVDPHPIR